MREDDSRKSGALRDGPVNPMIDPINGIDLAGMIRNLQRSPAERLQYNTIAARNVGRLVRAAQSRRQR